MCLFHQYYSQNNMHILCVPRSSNENQTNQKVISLRLNVGPEQLILLHAHVIKTLPSFQPRIILKHCTAVPMSIAFRAKYAGIVQVAIPLSWIVFPTADRYLLAYSRRRTTHTSDRTDPTAPLTRMEKKIDPIRKPGSCST